VVPDTIPTDNTTTNQTTGNQTNSNTTIIDVIETVANETDLDAAMRYYRIYHVMYLLAVSDGPYLTSTNQVSANNWFYYEFNLPFVLQFAYGDLSWEPELDIIAIFIDLGPSMIFTEK